MIFLVGTDHGVFHPGHQVTIVVRDFLGNSIANSQVLIDWSGMVDIELCSVIDSGIDEIRCSRDLLVATSDENGEVHATFLGAANNTGASPGHGWGRGQIFADGIPLGTFTTPAYDQNGAAGGNGVTGVDLSLALQDVALAQLHGGGGGSFYRGRSDYSGDGRLAGSDLAFHLKAVNESVIGVGSAFGCADSGGLRPYCP